MLLSPVVYHKNDERASFFILVFTKFYFCGILYTQKVIDICGARCVGEDPLIIALEEAKHKLIAMRTTLSELGDSLRIPAQREKLAELEAQTFAPDFWNDQENSSKILQRVKQMQDTISSYEMLCVKLEDALTLAEMAIEENDEDSLEEVESELAFIEEQAEKKRIEVLLCGQYDKNNAILSFHPGAGGTEAQDWAMMLYRLYTRWGEKHGYTVKLLDWLDGEEAGIKSATVMIEGINAYGYLKGENGVHRLVRVSPYDSSGRRHTSFASVEVMPEFTDDETIEIRDEDIEVTAHRSSGAGGQHINKTDSAIRIVHIPTGIVVGCQTERSQLQNKETAMRMLKAKLREIKEREKLERIEDIQGNKTNIEWGAQIRSYVFMPYTLAKDTRTGYEDGNIDSVMDGEIDGFINAYLKANSTANQTNA
ncbi:MAG: peptide chain release factor 2 [Clostridia bacterium]|nr:peptide chain release factor 2 [Clostridia bacterium]